MPRPRKCRTVTRQPVAVFYKPQGVPLSRLKGVILSVEGLEALRLADAEGQDQATAAQAMGVSRATFCRVLAQARGLVATALANGWAIRIEGGDFCLAGEPAAETCGRGHGRHGRHGHGHGCGLGAAGQTENQTAAAPGQTAPVDADEKQ